MKARSAQLALAESLTSGRGAVRNARVHWLVWSLCLLCGMLALSALVLAVLNGRTPGEVFVKDLLITIAVLAIAFSLVGALIASHRPENPIGWIFCFAALCQGALIFGEEYATYALLTEPGTLPLGAEASWLKEWIWAPGLGLILVFLPLLFPDGRPPSRSWHPIAWLGCLSIGLISVLGAVLLWSARGPALLVHGGKAEYVVAPEWALVVDYVAFPIMLIAGFGAIISLLVRFRHGRTDERQQIKWFAYASLLSLAFVFAWEEFPNVWGDRIEAILTVSGILIAPLIPVATGIAVFHYRLYDIDLVINRTLVYTGLTTCVVGLYMLVVGGLGRLLEVQDNLFLSVLGAGFVAVLFAPLRDWLQRCVNRLMYGDRDDPYAVISRLGRQLETSLSPEAVLPTLTGDIARALRLPQVEIWFVDGDTLRLGASYGDAPPEADVRDAGAVARLRRAPDGLAPADLGPPEGFSGVLSERGIALVLPLMHRGKLVGAQCLAPRGPGERFSAADQGLLRDLASQMGTVAHSVRLTEALRSNLEDLRRSRERLVVAQDEERRRIQRDLHDELGPILASMRLRLEACLDEAQRMGEPLTGDLERVYELVGQATAGIRLLVYDLRPPVLDQLGLVAALKQHCERFSRESDIEVYFRTEEPLSVPAAAEVALLRVAQEALHNVGKHAHASRAELRLVRGNGWLELDLQDDGTGFDANAYLPEGTGIGSMHERAELLGGTLRLDSCPGRGTRVTLRIPVEGVTR